ncbi:MAG: DUF2075 domain-containing protein [Euryarchaeota archaeon]|nr:DUF2075 domain-containing protein [Euryarchaeota archaeon]
MDRAFYSSEITDFSKADGSAILDRLAAEASQVGLPPTEAQLAAWREEVGFLQAALGNMDGAIFFEYVIPRMGRRIDVVLVLDSVILVLEFKVGEKTFPRHAIEQVWDYALDLKNFHEASHHAFIVPVLIATGASDPESPVLSERLNDGLFDPIRANLRTFGPTMRQILARAPGLRIDRRAWTSGRYRPTPTIIEAACALYGNHSVTEIARSDGGAVNLSATSHLLSEIIDSARGESRKVICFVTGVPGAGKTLVGLNVATEHMDAKSELHAVYLSGNGPLVKILREALARDQKRRSDEAGHSVRLGETRSRVKAFIQNIHNFRDECLKDDGPPIERVAIFDEAQRAWNRKQTAAFMSRKKQRPGFSMSEPEFLISCLDRHPDWAVVICLVGGGQEINTGEAGISEWIESLNRSYPDWGIFISPRLHDTEYAAGRAIDSLGPRPNVTMKSELHLATSMRSFRAENVSLLVKQILDVDLDGARRSIRQADRYPIVLTRSLGTAKSWLKEKARGSERYGIVVSSQAERLKPHAIHVRSPVDPVHWFLDGKEDVRSSYYLEDVATEFHVQGLELDWTCVAWDADLRYHEKGWDHWSFHGDQWKRIKSPERKLYLKNAYRVLMTRARQGMIIVVPEGDAADATRKPEFYDPTFGYLQDVGLPVV